MAEQLFIKQVTIGTIPPHKQVITSGFDLILPCFNPPEGWVKTLEHHFAELINIMEDIPVQLILVNDGSVKNFGPVEIAGLRKAIPDIIIIDNLMNRGKGYAVREGVKRSGYAFQIYTDLDFPFGTAALKQVYKRLIEGADIVAGERGKPYLELLPVRRKVITLISRILNRCILSLKVGDAQAGLKGFNYHGQQVLLATRIDGFLYDSEFIYKASKAPGLTITSVDITCRPQINFSSFGVRLLYRELLNYISILKSR
jgi:glycosyltransferase involved in cell wall biosynthesis